MGDRLSQLWQQIKDFWNKFSSKQKTMIIAIALAVIVTGIIFAFVFTRTTYEQIAKYDDASDTASATTVLDEEGIAYKVDDDGLTLSVDSKKVADARMALGENSIGSSTTSPYTWTWALDNSLSTTSTEKEEKQKLALENELAENIVETINGVTAASVQIDLADESTAILETEESNSCAAMLTVDSTFKESSAKGIANFLATSIGDPEVDNVKIIDQDGNILYNGSDSGSSTGYTAASAAEYKETLVNDIKTQVQALLLKSTNYNDVVVAPNMEVDFSNSTITDENYYTDEGEETGPKNYEYHYQNENNADSGDVVGTDANDGEDTDYDVTNGSNSSGTTDIDKIEYNTSKRTTITEDGVATINYDKSSISVVLNKYKSYYEEDMEDTLEEADQTFEEFKAANQDSVAIDVDPSLITSVAMATGIAEDNVSISAYEVPLFYDKESVSASTMIKTYLPYLLALIILALLIFVVFKGMKPVEVEEIEPELSVEALLATTKDNQGLDDIEFSDKSAARVQIEKFVDENPDAVAQLLRNWLNDDWE